MRIKTHLDNTLYLSSLWSDLSKWGHYFIVLNLRKPNLRSSLSQLSDPELLIAGAQMFLFSVGRFVSNFILIITNLTNGMTIWKFLTLLNWKQSIFHPFLNHLLYILTFDIFLFIRMEMKLLSLSPTWTWSFLIRTKTGFWTNTNSQRPATWHPDHFTTVMRYLTR